MRTLTGPYLVIIPATIVPWFPWSSSRSNSECRRYGSTNHKKISKCIPCLQENSFETERSQQNMQFIVTTMFSVGISQGLYTLGPTCNEFGYNKQIFWFKIFDSNVKKCDINKTIDFNVQFFCIYFYSL